MITCAEVNEISRNLCRCSCAEVQDKKRAVSGVDSISQDRIIFICIMMYTMVQLFTLLCTAEK